MGMCVLPCHNSATFSAMSSAVLSISDGNHLAHTSWQMASLYSQGSVLLWLLWCELPETRVTEQGVIPVELEQFNYTGKFSLQISTKTAHSDSFPGENHFGCLCTFVKSECLQCLHQ